MTNKHEPPQFEEYSEGFTTLQVHVGENFEEGLRRFKALVQKAKILTLYKERQSYEKPSERRRRKKRDHAERQRLANIRDKQMASGEWDRKQKQIETKRRSKFNSREGRDEQNEWR
jgi:ribosomal protein S21